MTAPAARPRQPVPTVGVPTAPPLAAELEQLLRRLRMPHVRRHAPEVLATAKAQRWDPAEVLKALLVEEVTGRDRSALATRRTAAGFPTGKTFHAWDPTLSSIPAPTQQALRTLEWVHRRENLVVCGPSGTGKTFLLEALGQHAVEQGLKVAWFTLEDLGVLLRRHRADDTVTKAIARVLRADLVVVDDVGLLAVPADAAEGLYRLVDAAYEKRSIAVSSNLHPSKAHLFARTCVRWRRMSTGSPVLRGCARGRRGRRGSPARPRGSSRTRLRPAWGPWC